jgi:formylglycine-generating enzyme required for sulfatase activity
VLRGGYWDSYASYSRCAFRAVNPYLAVNYVGFRCVRGH